MTSRPIEFVQYDQDGHRSSLHRPRSSGGVEGVDGGNEWDRYGHDNFGRYREPKRSSARQSADHLHVPQLDVQGHRRVRSHGEIKNSLRPPERPYHVREVKPLYTQYGDPVKSTQLPARSAWSPQPSSPRIRTRKVEIHQSRPAPPSPRQSERPQIPRPPKHPDLLSYFELVLQTLGEIQTVSSHYFHIEAADPHDLTFLKIAEEVGGHAFNLRVWARLVRLKETGRAPTGKREVVELATKSMTLLLDRAEKLRHVCSQAKPKDLRYVQIPDMHSTNTGELMGDDDAEEEERLNDVTDNCGFEIKCYLDSIALQIQTLSRVTVPLQDTAPEAEPENTAVERLLLDLKEFFGSEEALKRNSIDTDRLSGGEALEEARYKARPEN